MWQKNKQSRNKWSELGTERGMMKTQSVHTHTATMGWIIVTVSGWKNESVNKYAKQNKKNSATRKIGAKDEQQQQQQQKS